MKRITYFLAFVCFTVFSQTKRDVFINDSITKYVGNNYLTKQEYLSLKNNIFFIENKYKTYEANMKYLILENSFKLKDINYFKSTLSVLVEKYGFNVSYMSEKESYYYSIMFGKLSIWFKTMYLKSHLKWLKNNFVKQIDLRKLNEFRTKDQLVNSFSAKTSLIDGLDSIQKKANSILLSDFFFKNLGELYGITQKIKKFPTDKSFALIQNTFEINLFHNFQSDENFERAWILFFDFYKKAYLKNQITYMPFKNHDVFSFIHNGYQEFGLIDSKDVPEYYLNKKINDSIPIKDTIFMNKIKKEFKW